MNKFQAMARIMAILNKDGQLKPGTREYKVARELASAKIERLGPEKALAQVEKWRGHILDQIKMMDRLKELEEAGQIGRLSRTAVTLGMGRLYKRTALQNETVPMIVETLKERGVDAVLLVAA